MRLSNFNRKLKKEFNLNYKENKKPKKKSIWIKLIPVYIIATTVLVFGLILGIDGIVVHNNNAKYDNRVEPYEENSYQTLETITKEEYKEYSSYYKTQSMIEGIGEALKSLGPGFEKAEGAAAPDSIATDAGISPNTSEGLNTGDSHYDSNNQEEGINEADIAKFDGKYCYYITHRVFVIYSLEGNVLARTDLPSGGAPYSLQLYKNRIIIISRYFIKIYEFSGEELTLKLEFKPDVITYGVRCETRMLNNCLYAVIPQFEYEDETVYHDQLSDCSRVYLLYKIDLDTLEYKTVGLASSSSVTIYMSDTHFVISNAYFLTDRANNMTLNSVFDLDLNPVGAFACCGYVNDQYSIDVYDNTLRVVSTSRNSYVTKNILTIFDLKNHSILSILDDGIGLEREIVKSVSFTDTTCYVVTYVQTDPLYEIDIRDPKNPKIVDALKVPGYSSYLKTFEIDGVEYIFGAGKISGTYKYSIYKNDESNTQVGEDYLLGGFKEITINGRTVQTLDYPSFSAINPHAMFFYIKGDILYFGAPYSKSKYVLYKIDVKAENVIEKYQEFTTNTETRLFLYEGKYYLPQEDKLISLEAN